MNTVFGNGFMLAILWLILMGVHDARKATKDDDVRYAAYYLAATAALFGIPWFGAARLESFQPSWSATTTDIVIVLLWLVGFAASAVLYCRPYERRWRTFFEAALPFAVFLAIGAAIWYLNWMFPSLKYAAGGFFLLISGFGLVLAAMLTIAFTRRFLKDRHGNRSTIAHH